MLEHDAGPEINVIIGETALVRPAGDAATMREQLKRLRELNRMKRVNMHVLPFLAGTHLGLAETFTIL